MWVSEWTGASTRAARTPTVRYRQRRIERCEELGQRDPEGSRQPRDVVERRIPLAALDPTDIGPMKAGAGCKLLLRETTGSSDVPQSAPKCLSHIDHAVIVVAGRFDILEDKNEDLPTGTSGHSPS